LKKASWSEWLDAFNQVHNSTIFTSVGKIKVEIDDKKKRAMPKKVKQEIDKYPMVSVEWFDIVSDSSWSSFSDVKKAKLATCITKGHLLSQAKGVTRIFGDYSYNDNKTEIESIGNTTLIPNSVIKEIKKLT
jgi:hypothetical protein